MRWILLLGIAVSACQDKQDKKVEQHKHTNRLSKEKSPYLLQHAHNPVDWYPWGDEAFAKAKKEDKPIFLSIGYSTCHWCHVMERESFENEAVAKVINDRYVAIKVDREERPDVDQVYMQACQAMSGSGGWPLSAFLTPKKHAFFVGTYFPPARFTSLLEKISDVWKTDREKIITDAKQVSAALAESTEGHAGEMTDEHLKRAQRWFEDSFDPEWGGFGDAPKFPRSVALEFLLRRYARGEKQLLPIVERTLVKMAEGGMYDQLGGGFSRYSTDPEWLVPHFEKMLYDNALLTRAYVQAWQITKNPFYERIARETIAYVQRDLLAPEGAFYSAEDADSEGIEGKFYVWNPKQIAEVLGADAKAACEAFDVTDGGTWHPHEASIPHGNSPLRVTTKPIKPEWKRKLLEARSKRIRPHRDDKVLTEWNALMIGALAVAGSAFDEPSYVAAAEKAADFVLTKLRRQDGRLLRRYRDGEAAIPAYLDDYAFLAEAMVDLYQATFNVRYAEEAVKLTEDMIRLFSAKQGGFWFTATDNEQLVARMRELYDGALPSGNSVALHALVRVGELAGRDEFRKLAEASFKSFGGDASKHPSGFPHFLSAFDAFRGPFTSIVIAGDSKELLKAVRTAYLPNSIVLNVPADGADARTVKVLPNAAGKKALNGVAAAHVCENFSCKLPLTSVEELEKLIGVRR